MVFTELRTRPSTRPLLGSTSHARRLRVLGSGLPDRRGPTPSPVTATTPTAAVAPSHHVGGWAANEARLELQPYSIVHLRRLCRGTGPRVPGTRVTGVGLIQSSDALGPDHAALLKQLLHPHLTWLAGAERIGERSKGSLWLVLDSSPAQVFQSTTVAGARGQGNFVASGYCAARPPRPCALTKVAIQWPTV